LLQLRSACRVIRNAAIAVRKGNLPSSGPDGGKRREQCLEGMVRIVRRRGDNDQQARGYEAHHGSLIPQHRACDQCRNFLALQGNVKIARPQPTDGFSVKSLDEHFDMKGVSLCWNRFGEKPGPGTDRREDYGKKKRILKTCA
jgi:hypothetical protein